MRSLEAQKKLQKLTKTYDTHIEHAKQSNIQTLGILGSFIAFVSFATGTLKAVDTVAEFVIFTFVFCIAVTFMGIIIKANLKEIMNFFFEKETNKLKTWVKYIIRTALIVLVGCFVLFAWKEIQRKGVDKEIIEIFHTKENTIQSEKQTIEKETNFIQQPTTDSLENNACDTWPR